LLQEYATVDDSSKNRSGQEGTTNSNNDTAPTNSEAIGESAGKHIDGGLWVTLNDEVFTLQSASQATEADEKHRSVK
jgi:hypothetical protein